MSSENKQNLFDGVASSDARKHRSHSHKEPPPFSPAQSRLYKECGGRLWEDMLWLTIQDSVGMNYRGSRDRSGTKQARRWVLGAESDHLGLYKHGLLTGGVWQFLFSTDPSPIVSWLRSVWTEVDKDPSLVEYYKGMIGGRYVNEGRKNGR